MVKKVADFMAEHNMLKEHDKVIAGISGGADSVCLLLMLLELRENLPFDIVVVHINHGLRGKDALRDEQFVENLCRQYDLPLEICRENVELIAKKGKQSLEEAGRNVRRAAFQRVLRKYGGTKVALAHHKNDNAETILMNLARGSGLSGLAGIRPVSGNIIRPLLCLTREEIEAFLQQRDIRYCTDETNASAAYTRNRIRNHILPLFENEVNEKAVVHMADTAEQLLKVWEYMESQTEEYYCRSVFQKETGLLILQKTYYEIPKVFRSNILRRAMKEISGKEQDIHRVHVESLEALMEKQTGRRVDLPYGLVAERCYDGIYISGKEKKEEKTECVEVNFHKKEKVQVQDLVLSYKIMERDDRHEEKVYTKYFDYDIINRAVTLRTRRPGDYITIDGDGRKQKLKSYFVNEKIPREDRDRILLLAEGNHVLWIIGYRRGHAYYVGPDTEKIVEILINKGEDSNGRKN